MLATFVCLADPDNAEGHESCNLFHRARNGLSLWIGFFITFASLFYAAFRSDTMAILGKDPKFVIRDNGDVEKDGDVNESNYDDVDEDEKGDEEVEIGEDVDDQK